MRKLLVLLLAALPALAADVSRLHIVVTNQLGKPVANASVVVKFVKGRSVAKLGRKDRRSWELRTGQEGQANLPSLPQGDILIQVIAKHYQTFGKTFDVDQPEQTIEIKLDDPQPQYSAH